MPMPRRIRLTKKNGVGNRVGDVVVAVRLENGHNGCTNIVTETGLTFKWRTGRWVDVGAPSESSSCETSTDGGKETESLSLPSSTDGPGGNDISSLPLFRADFEVPARRRRTQDSLAPFGKSPELNVNYDMSRQASTLPSAVMWWKQGEARIHVSKRFQARLQRFYHLDARARYPLIVIPSVRPDDANLFENNDAFDGLRDHLIIVFVEARDATRFSDRLAGSDHHLIVEFGPKKDFKKPGIPLVRFFMKVFLDNVVVPLGCQRVVMADDDVLGFVLHRAARYFDGYAGDVALSVGAVIDFLTEVQASVDGCVCASTCPERFRREYAKATTSKDLAWSLRGESFILFEWSSLVGCHYLPPSNS